MQFCVNFCQILLFFAFFAPSQHSIFQLVKNLFLPCLKKVLSLYILIENANQKL